MYVEPTRALVAVDVNTGATRRWRRAQGQHGLRPRAAACVAPARLGGQIALDLAPMPKKDRRQFETALRAAFRQMMSRRLWSAGPLGHYELQRKRERAPLSELLGMSCPICDQDAEEVSPVLFQALRRH